MGKESARILRSERIGLLMARARKVFRREFEARLSVHEVTVPQVHVLRSLWEEDGKTISQLSTDICSDGPTLTSLLDRMEAKGLIYRERDPHDRRVVRIYLHERGEALQQDARRIGEEVLALARRGMSESQLEELESLLTLLCESLEANGETVEVCGNGRQ